MSLEEKVSVLIPTLATSERAPYLCRAIASAKAQEGVEVVTIVVANGPQRNEGLLRDLAKGVRLAILEEANMPKALLHGRKMVSTPYFSELDDDDVLLSHALRSRLSAFEQNPSADVVVSNGFVNNSGQEIASHERICACAADPLRSFLDKNWLHDGSALFRSDSVGPEFFSGMPRYLEWTYLAVRLALQRKIVFVDCPSFIHYMDHPFSVWASRECLLGRPEALRRILDLDLPVDVRKRFELKLAKACEAASRLCFSEGGYLDAWKWYRKMGNSGSRRGLPGILLSLLARKSTAFFVRSKR